MFIIVEHTAISQLLNISFNYSKRIILDEKEHYSLPSNKIHNNKVYEVEFKDKLCYSDIYNSYNIYTLQVKSCHISTPPPNRYGQP